MSETSPGADAHALFTGTFDPPTRGHLDLVERAARLFPRVTVGVAEHPTKAALFEAEERVELFARCVEELGAVARRVQVTRIEGLVVQACETLGCSVLVRGVRSGTDFDYEAQMAATNRSMLPRIDTVLLASSPALAHLSSTLVRQVASLGGDVADLVPGPVAAALADRFGR